MMLDIGHIQSEVIETGSDALSYYRCVFRKMTGEAATNSESCYVLHDSLAVGLALCGAFAVYSFVWSIIGNNCSKVDQIWSIVPVVYCWHFFLHHFYEYDEVHYRMLLLTSVVTLWGTRLTFNFWKKGGYGNLIHHEEDYRWPIVRAKMHWVVFLIFNLTFIAIYQNVLLFWIAVPAYEITKGPAELAVGDVIVAALFSLLLIMETVADEQHWVFQSLKHSIPAEERSKLLDPELRQGFYTSGLFRYSRHPNYFAEQSMWVCVYLYCITPNLATGLAAALPPLELLKSCLNWTGLGCLQLMLLFQGSMDLSETITISKYPSYKDYQATTSMCIPWFPRSKRASGGSKKEN